MRGIMKKTHSLQYNGFAILLSLLTPSLSLGDPIPCTYAGLSLGTCAGCPAYFYAAKQGNPEDGFSIFANRRVFSVDVDDVSECVLLAGQTVESTHLVLAPHLGLDEDGCPQFEQDGGLQIIERFSPEERDHDVYPCLLQRQGRQPDESLEEDDNSADEVNGDDGQLGQCAGDPNFDPQADLNGDDCVTDLDLLLIESRVQSGNDLN